MSPFQLAALFLTLVAAAGWINAKALRLPAGVAMLAAGLIGAAALVALRRFAPGVAGVDQAVRVISEVDFPQTVVGYMLAFLLFAGAMQVDLGEMRRRRAAVWTLATLGVAASTALVGGGVWLAARALGFQLPLIWAMVFGSLISPTDPIAVLAAVRRGDLSRMLQAILQGEALFNDGVGIVVFLALLSLATGGGAHPEHTAIQVVLTAGGGLVLGFVAAFVVIRAMATVSDPVVEALLSLALAVGAYALADALHVSGPMAVVAAGLLIGDREARSAMTPESQTHLIAFWNLVDEVLNALLFFLLGLEFLVVPFALRYVGLWAVAIPLVVLARLAVVLPWGAYFHFRNEERGPSMILAWGGLHGALSLALALEIPRVPERPAILSMTYAVVVFSIGVQGLTFGPLVSRLRRRGPRGAEAEAG
ncbi:MAG: sodium:proton antiporter [Caulobacteraceae bacterium]